MALSISSVIVAVKDQVSCDLGGEVAVLNLKNGTYYGLNTTSAIVWELIREPKVVRELRDVLAQEYDVDPVQCERDLLELLQNMSDEQLIEVQDALSV